MRRRKYKLGPTKKFPVQIFASLARVYISSSSPQCERFVTPWGLICSLISPHNLPVIAYRRGIVTPKGAGPAQAQTLSGAPVGAAFVRMTSEAHEASRATTGERPARSCSSRQPDEPLAQCDTSCHGTPDVCVRLADSLCAARVTARTGVS